MQLLNHSTESYGKILLQTVTTFLLYKHELCVDYILIIDKKSGTLNNFANIHE